MIKPTFVLGLLPSVDDISQTILETVESWLIGLVEVVIEFLNNILFNYDGLAGIALDAYNFFIWFGGLLLVVICLITVVNQLVSEGEGSQEANIWQTIIGSVKAGSLLVIMPFAVSFTMNQIIEPVSQYFLDLMADSMIEEIESLTNMNLLDGLAGMMLSLIIWFFVFIVIAFFVTKVFISQAQLLIDEILSPLCAVSVVTDRYNFVDTWWKDILSHTATLITLTLSMALFTEALTWVTDDVWAQLALIIGTGFLVISGPTLIKSIRFSSGMGRQAQGVGRSAMHMISRK